MDDVAIEMERLNIPREAITPEEDETKNKIDLNMLNNQKVFRNELRIKLIHHSESVNLMASKIKKNNI